MKMSHRRGASAAFAGVPSALLAANLDRGYRLVCQLWIKEDIALRQDSDDVWAATIRPADALNVDDRLRPVRPVVTARASTPVEA